MNTVELLNDLKQEIIDSIQFSLEELDFIIKSKNKNSYSYELTRSIIIKNASNIFAYDIIEPYGDDYVIFGIVMKKIPKSSITDDDFVVNGKSANLNIFYPFALTMTDSFGVGKEENIFNELETLTKDMPIEHLACIADQLYRKKYYIHMNGEMGHERHEKWVNKVKEFKKKLYLALDSILDINDHLMLKKPVFSLDECEEYISIRRIGRDKMGEFYMAKFSAYKAIEIYDPHDDWIPLWYNTMFEEIEKCDPNKYCVLHSEKLSELVDQTFSLKKAEIEANQPLI